MLVWFVATGVVGQVDRKGIAFGFQFRQGYADVRKAVEVTYGNLPVLAELRRIRGEYLRKIILSGISLFQEIRLLFSETLIQPVKHL